MDLKRFYNWFSKDRWHEDRRAILEFNRSLTLISDPDELMASIASRIRELFDSDRMIILRSDGEASLFRVAFSKGYEAEAVGRIHLSHRDRLIKWLSTNETQLVVHSDHDVLKYLSAKEREMLTRLDVRVCVPLLALNRLSGLVLVSSTKQGWKLNKEDLYLLQVLMSQASIAFENAFLYKQQRDRLRKLYGAERLATAGQLAASVAHEIRNPLTSIRSTVQYLLGEFNATHPKRPLVEGIISEVDRINTTVDGLLSLTRVTELKFDRIALSKLIEQSTVLLRVQAHDQSVEIAYEPPPSEIYIMGDETQLKQLSINLIMNALQAMQAGGRLEIALAQERNSPGRMVGKSWANISIKDTGCGIPAENLDRVFDPFFTTKQGGTGLGLSSSYAIVQQHGGEIEIQSRVDEGTEISIRLPAVK